MTLWSEEKKQRKNWDLCYQKKVKMGSKLINHQVPLDLMDDDDEICHLARKLSASSSTAVLAFVVDSGLH